MKISILGAGKVGMALASALLRAGPSVTAALSIAAARLHRG